MCFQEGSTDLNQSRRLLAKVNSLLLLLLLMVVACNQASTGPSPTPSEVSGSLLTPLGLGPPGPTIPSPNGSWIAELVAGSLAFFTADGRRVATYSPGSADPLLAQFRWLADSSAVMAWPLTNSVRPASVSLIDSHGRRTAFNISASSAAPSLSGRWIAASHISENGVISGIDVVRRTGGSVSTFGPCTRFLGWRGDQVICLNNATLYSIDPQAGNRTALPTRGLEDLIPPMDGPVSSPDGTVVMLTENNVTYLALTPSGLRSLPSDLVYSPLGFIWTGPHEAIGLAATSRVEYLDVESGAITRMSPAVVDGSLQAVSGTWVAWMSTSSVHLSDLNTGRDLDLNVRGTAYALASNRFLLRGDTSLYLVQAP